MTDAAGVRVRPLAAGDLDEADRICRVAFGTFVGVPQPESFFGDADIVRTRWQADPGAALAAEVGGRLAGSNFAANWGSVGFFGPLTVAPEYWDRAIGQRLLDATMELFEAWGTRHAGLFTFAQSAKHVGLYQKYGFWPRFLTAVMSSPVRPDSGRPRCGCPPWTKRRAGAMAAVRELTDAVYPGLDVSLEIESVLAQGLGDTVLIDDATACKGWRSATSARVPRPAGDVLRQVRRRPARSRRGAAVRPADRRVSRAGRRAGASALVAGANAGRDRAWRALAGRGFRRNFQGVAMHRPNEPGYSTSDSFVIDDWR